MSIFVDQKPEEISKNDSYTIQTPLKVMQILKIWKVWLKIWACHAYLNFEFQMGIAGSVLSHTYQTLENYSFFVDKQMILLPLFYISNQKWENFKKPNFHCCSRPLSVKIRPFFTESGLE